MKCLCFFKDIELFFSTNTSTSVNTTTSRMDGLKPFDVGFCEAIRLNQEHRRKKGGFFLPQRAPLHFVFSKRVMYIDYILYIYIYALLSTTVNFILKLMSWGFVDKVFSAGVVFRDFSALLTCPLHCGQSSFFPFLAGLSLGLLLGVSGALLLGFYLLRPFLGSAAPPDLGLFRSSHPRLRAYRE